MTFYNKKACVEARQFKTNNEAGDVNMHEVCIWANQGRAPLSENHCWHNGTSIFVSRKGLVRPETADVGDWIVKSYSGNDPLDTYLAVMKDEVFRKTYARLPPAAEAQLNIDRTHETFEVVCR